MLHSQTQPPDGVTAPDAEGFLLFPDPLVAIALSALSLLAQDNAAPEQVSPLVAILNNPLTLVVGLFLLFYFIVIMPERRRKSDEAKLLSALKKNDWIPLQSPPKGFRQTTSPLRRSSTTTSAPSDSSNSP